VNDNLPDQAPTGYEDLPDWELGREFGSAQICLEQATDIDGTYALVRERARRKMLAVATELPTVGRTASS
jgi:hypothetical protein